MAIKSYKPLTPSRRFITVNTFDEVTKSTPEKSLTRRKPERSGRNNQGKITVRHRGGGHIRRYRFIEFGQEKIGIPAKVASIEYDPNRSANIALIHYVDGAKRYIIAPVGLLVGDVIQAHSKRVDIKTGNRMRLADIPTGITVHNVEIQPGKGGALVRSAGMSAQIMAKEGEYVSIKLPSGEVRRVLRDCYASIGQVGNLDHSNVTIGKAGRQRWLGIRPTVLGKSMNPVDHPHGGGEGHQPVGLRYPKTPWGKVAMGKKTRKKKHRSNRLIVSRRKK